MFRWIAIAVLVAASLSFAADGDASLKLEADLTTCNANFGSVLRVRLVAVAKEAVVATEGLHARVTQGPDKTTVTLTWEEKKDEKNRIVVPSASKLGIVKLQAGEVAIVHVPTSPEVRKATAAAAAGTTRLTVEYDMPVVWGKRFGVESGKFSGDVAVAK